MPESFDSYIQVPRKKKSFSTTGVWFPKLWLTAKHGWVQGSRLSLFRSGGTASVRILTPRNSSAPSSLAGTSPLPSILNRLTQNGTCQLRTWHPTTSKPLFLDPFNDTWFGDKNVESVRVNALVTAPRARKCGPPAPQLTIAKYQSLKIPPCPPTLKNLKGT